MNFLFWLDQFFFFVCPKLFSSRSLSLFIFSTAAEKIEENIIVISHRRKKLLIYIKLILR
jgi:hypothetical protein